VKKIQSSFIGLFLLATFGSAQAQSLLADDELLLTEVLFEESEPGIQPYVTRVLLGQHFMRLDDGLDQDPQGYILFDRKTHEVHHFNHQQQSHLLMKALQHEKIDFEIDYRVVKRSLPDAPQIDGKAAVRHEFIAGETLCRKSINVAGFLVDVTQALKDYEQALAAQMSQTLGDIPASVRSACFLSNYYLYAGDYLKGGFPMTLSDDQGRHKILLSFRQVVKPASLLNKVDGYKLYYANRSNL